MPKNRNAKLSFAVACLLCAVQARADIEPTSTVESKTDGADQVAVVDVAELRSERTTNEFGDQLIVTHAKLNVRETLKGRFSKAQPEMTVEGGTVDGVTLKVSDQPQLARGEQLVVFLKERGGRHTPHLRGQGIMRMKKDRVEGSTLDLNEVRRRVRSRR